MPQNINDQIAPFNPSYFISTQRLTNLLNFKEINLKVKSLNTRFISEQPVFYFKVSPILLLIMIDHYSFDWFDSMIY
jgi:hypothetical protein